MEYLSEGIRRAFHLIVTADREVLQIVLFSLRISLTAAVIACLLGVPVGFFVAVAEFRGKRTVRVGLNTLMAVPTVVIGLTLYSLLYRQGLFGRLGLLFTPTAIALGQIVLATPIVAALTVSSVGDLELDVKRTAMTLGASPFQALIAVARESRYALLVAFSAGFGRVIAEVGSAMMLGGNIRGYTRTMTTAIALETGKGEFGLGIALGIILLLVALSINLLVQLFSERVGEAKG
jgi:tungstate transport system permease protein